MTKEELEEYERMAAQMDADAKAIEAQRKADAKKLTSYSVMTTDPVTGKQTVQTYTGDEAAIAKKEAEARKKKEGGSADLSSLTELRYTKPPKTSTAKAKTSTTPKAKTPTSTPTTPTSTAPVTTGDLKRQLTAKERVAAKAEGLYMEGDTATRNTTLNAKNLADAEKTMLKNAAAANTKATKAAKAEQKEAEIYFDDEANAEPYYIDQAKKAKENAAEEVKEAAKKAAKNFVKAGGGVADLSVPTFATEGVARERKAAAEAADAAMRKQKDEDLMGPELLENLRKKKEAEEQEARNKALAELDLVSMQKRSDELQKQIDRIGTLTTADVKAAQTAGGKGARYGQSAAGQEYRAQQEQIAALRAEKAELDAAIASVEEARFYYSIPRQEDFAEKAEKGLYIATTYDYGNPDNPFATAVREGMGEKRTESRADYYVMPLLDSYTDEEKQIFGYLFYTDRKKAEQFMEIANKRVANDRKAADYQRVYEAANKAGTVPATLFNIGAGAVSGIDEIGNIGEYLIHGKIKPKLGVSGAVDAATEAVTEDWSGTGRFLYGTGLSIANNLVLASSLGKLAGLPMALSSAASATNDALERGATDEEALAFGIASGIAEAAFEEISLDKLITLRQSRTTTQLIKNMLIQGGIEASEEAMTTIANTVSDAMIMGDKAELLRMRDGYMAEGYSKEEAEKLAFRDWWGNIGLDAWGGFISGGVLGGGAIVLNRLENRLQTRSEADLSQINRAIEERAEQGEKGMTGQEIEKTGKAIQKLLDGKLVTEAEDKAIMNSKAAQEVFADITGTDYVSGERVARDVLRDVTGVEAEAPTAITEDLAEWNQRTAEETEAEPETETTKAEPLEELTGLPKGETRLTEDLSEWNRRTQEEAQKAEKTAPAEETAKPRPSENWRKTVTKKKAAEIDEAVKLGAKVGRRVIISDEIAGNGRHDPDGTIYINPKTGNAARVVLFHELTHDIETSGLYEKLSESVVKIAEEIDGLDVEQYKDQLREIYGDLAGDGIDREAVASIASERLFDDERMVNRLFQIDQTLFTKIKNWLSDMKVKFFGTDYEKMIRDAEKLYIRAMETRGEAEGYGKGQNFAFIPGDISTEEVEKGKNEVLKIKPVKTLTGAEFAKNDVDLITQVSNFFDKVGTVENPQLGDVTLERKGIKSDIAHGIGRKKAASFKAVPEVIEKGKVIDFQKDWKGRGYDTAIVAAPIKIGTDDYLMGIVLTRKNQENLFYVHEVATIKNGTTPFKTGLLSTKVDSTSGDVPSVITILRNILDVNSQDSKGSTYTETLAAQRDSDYMAAVDAGDMETAQRFKQENDDIRYQLRNGSGEPMNDSEKQEVGKALYTINKAAKMLRDVAQWRSGYYADYLNDDAVEFIKEYFGVNIDDRGNAVEYDEYDNAFTLDDINDEIRNQEAEVETSEEGTEDYDFEKDYLDELYEIRNRLEEDKSKIDKYSLNKAKDKFYSIKHDILGFSDALLVAYHLFGDGNIRPLYNLGGFTFHGDVISEQDVPDGYDIKELNTISSKNELKDKISVKEAERILNEAVANSKTENENIRYSKGRSYWDLLAAQNNQTDGRTADEVVSDIEETFANGTEMRDQARAVLNRLSDLTQERKKKITEDEIEGRTIIGERTAPEIKTERAKKSIDIQRRYERELRGAVGNIFGVDGSDLRGDIAGIVSEMANTVHEGGKVTDEQYERLLAEATRLGWTEVAGNANGEYDDARDVIKTTPIYLDRGAVEDLGGKDALREFQKESFGSMRITTNVQQKYEGKAASIDDVYKTMTQFDQSFFPTDVTDPVEQLERIRDFMEETKTRRVGLTDVYGGDSDFMDWAKGQLAVAVQNLENRMGSVAAYDREKTMLAEAKAKQFNKEANFEEARAAANSYELYEAEKAVEDVIRVNDFTAEDRLAVKNLLAGTLTEERYQQNPTANPEGVIELYHAQREYNRINKPIEDFKAAVKEARTEEARNALKNSDSWNDKKAGLGYSINTEERNIRDIVKDKREADAIVRTYFEPVHRNEAMKNRWIAEVDQRIKDVIGDRHMNKWERAYTQMLGENASFLAEGKATKRNRDHENVLKMMDDLLRDHGKNIDVDLCERVAAEMMDIYNECHDRYNDEMIRNGRKVMGHIQNYFPHFSITSNETLAAKLLGLLGIETENSVLPTEIAGRTADRKPGTRYNRFTQERTTDVTDYDAVKGFDMYISAMAENLYHTEDIGRLRTLATELRAKYSSVDVAAQIERIQRDDSLTEEEKSSQIDGVYEAAMRDKYQLSNFAVHLDEYINGLAGKKSFGDREMEYEAGRTMYDISKAIEGRIAGGMVGWNLSTATMNFVPLFQAVTELRPDEILAGIYRTAAGNLRGDNFVGQSDFLTNRRSDGRSTVYKDNYSLFTAENFKEAMSAFSDAGSFAMNLVDNIVSESLVRAKVAQNLRNGMTEDVAFREADSWAAGLMADRSEGAMPTIFNMKNPILKPLTMFQIEQINQWEHLLKDSLRDKWDDDKLGTIIGQVMFWLAMRLGNVVYEKLTGRDNALPDIIGLTEKDVKAIKDGASVVELLGENGKEILEQVPFIGGILGGGRIPISSALPEWDDVTNILAGIEKNGWNRGTTVKVVDNVLAPMAYFLPGGSQLRKTAQGLDQIIQGGNFGYDAEGNEYLKYLQDESFLSQIREGEKPTLAGAGNDLKTLLFGRWSGENARDYLSGDIKPLSTKETDQLREGVRNGLDKDDFYDFLLGVKGKTNAQKRNGILEDRNFNPREKEKIDRILFPDKEFRDESGNPGKDFRDYTDAESYARSQLNERGQKAFDEGVEPEELQSWKNLYNYMEGDGKTVEFTKILNKADYLSGKEKNAILEAVTGKDKNVFTGENDENDDLYKAIGLSAKQRDETRLVLALSDNNQEAQKTALMEAGYSEEKATEIVKAKSWNKMDDGTAEHYASTGLSDGDQYRLFNILQTTDGKEAQVAAIAETFGVSEREAGDIRHKANGEWINSIDDIKEKKKYESRAKKISVFERFNFTEDEIVAGYNAICGYGKKDEQIPILTDLFIERGDSQSVAKKKARNFYNINAANKGYK